MKGDNGAELLEELKKETEEEGDEIIPTASQTDLLFACTFPWGRRAPKRGVGPEARFGSAFHEAMEILIRGDSKPDFEAIAGRYEGVEADELAERVDAAWGVLSKWLTGKNPWSFDFTADLLFQPEVSVAYHIGRDSSRICSGPTPEGHRYLDQKAGEIPGTADLVSRIGSTLLVLDHKSGWNVASSWQPQTPGESGQLRTLALAFSRLYGASEVIVGFLHAPEGSNPEIYSDKLTRDDLDEHRANLRRAFKGIGSDWLRPGEWCAHCPGFSICPAQSSALVAMSRGRGPLNALKVGEIHQATAKYDQLREMLRNEIRAWVKAHGPGVRPDGKVVDLVETEVTNLSQASIERALGPLKGAKEIERLTKLGCVETRKQVSLKALSKR